MEKQLTENFRLSEFACKCGCGADGVSEPTTVSECQWTPWSSESQAHVWSYWPKHVTAINSRWIDGSNTYFSPRKEYVAKKVKVFLLLTLFCVSFVPEVRIQ